MAEGHWHPASFTLSRFVHREIIVLVILCGAAIAGFVVTKASADAARDLRVRDARTWYTRGLEHLEAGRADEAVEALGRARALDREQQEYHLAFGRALAAAGNAAAARQALLTWREARPEDPWVNRELAEIEAALGDATAAVRYYQSAVYGSWSPEALPERTRLRVRMIEYLILQQMRSRAVSQLLLLEADLPAEPGPRLEAAGLFLEAGDAARALAQYRRVLALESGNAEAHAGAGRAAFALGDFATARRHLARAPAGHRDARELRALATLAIQIDPLAPRLSARERRRRLAAGAAHVSARVAACLARLPDAQAALAPHQAALRAAEQPSSADTSSEDAGFEDDVAAVARAAAALPDACGPLDLTTSAWRHIGRAHAEPVT